MPNYDYCSMRCWCPAFFPFTSLPFLPPAGYFLNCPTSLLFWLVATYFPNCLTSLLFLPLSTYFPNCPTSLLFLPLATYLPDCLTSLLFLTVGSCYLAYFPNFFPMIPPAYVPFLLHFSKLHILSPLFSFLAIFLRPPSYPVLPSLPLPLSQTMYGWNINFRCE